MEEFHLLLLALKMEEKGHNPSNMEKGKERVLP